MLYFTRHGKTNHNANKLLSGHYDIPLNEEGLYQAKQAGMNAKDIKIDLIYCSPLIRAKQTCNEINKYHNAEVIIKEELIERDFGKYESKEYSLIDGEKCWNYYDDTYDKEIEPLKRVFERVYEFLDKIKEESKYKNILIVAHNDIGRAIYCYFNGIPRDGNLRNLTMGNGEFIKFEKKRIK